MTAPVRPDRPTAPSLSGVLSLEQFEQAQSLSGPAVKTAFGSRGTQSTRGMSGDTALGRVLSLDEFDQAQAMPGPAVKTMQLPALPPVPRDVTQTARTAGSQKGEKIGGIAGAVLRQVVDPMLENPFTTIGTTAALAMPVVGPAVGAVMAGQMAYHIAQYGWQKAAELTLSPEDRARAEADPERISGEAAAVQAAMLGLAPLIHVGVKTARSLDVSAGMLDAGVQGVKETPLGPDFPKAAALDASVADYQARRVREDYADLTAARTADAERIAKEAALAPRRRAQGPSAYFESPQGAETLGAVAARHGLPDDANPYHPESPIAADWSTGHAAATESFPEGFSMGGALTENRIPAAGEATPRARGSDAVTLPEGATPETAALAAALKPSRFRGHSTDALAEAALDAQTQVEQAQAAIEYSRTHPLTTEAAQADMENRGVSYSDETEGSSITAEKQLAAAKSRLGQIEREFTLRGVAGDALADVMQAAKEQRLEREAMSQEELLAQTTGDFVGSSPGENPNARTLPRGLSASVVRKAVANKLDVGLFDVPEYRAINMADQSNRAVALLESDPALARRVALGETPAPHGLLPESVFVAVENHAIAQGDVATIRELATRSELTAEATKMGQRIRALGERDPESPVAAIKQVIDVRMGGAKHVAQATEETVATIRAQLKAVDVTQDAWVKFVDSLRC